MNFLSSSGTFRLVVTRPTNIPEILLVSVTEAVKGSLSRTDVLEQSWADEHSIPPVRGFNIQPGPLIPKNSGQTTERPVILGRMGKTAFNYLTRISERLEKKGLITRVRVLVGKPAEEIVRFVEEERADLIVMASRGRSGFNRWDMGNVAEKVIRTTKVPVLLVKPEPGFKETKPRRKGESSLL